ncbi:MAG: phosphotransferase [Chloroflexota bacterium]|nr:phosphotransferase [Chloroflexota bacterium]
MDLTPFERAWPAVRGGQARPFAGGTNNRIWRIDSPTGAWALRLAPASVTPRRLTFEANVLSLLQAQGLPFALPVPAPTAQDERYARVTLAEGETLATLTPLIPGQSPRRDDLTQAESAGEAIATLDEALARIIPADPEEARGWRMAGDLAGCHPAVPDPRAAIAGLPLPAATLTRLLADYDATVAAAAALYTTLPRQLCHEDSDPGNILMDGARVTGILDWEFCALDLRPMDLVVALTWWPVGRLGSGEEWPIIAALARGYARHRTLSSAEVAAIPTLYQFRAYTSLIHRLGRMREGLSPLEQVIWRAEAALERADWLAASGERLTHVVATGGEPYAE